MGFSYRLKSIPFILSPYYRSFPTYKQILFIFIQRFLYIIKLYISYKIYTLYSLQILFKNVRFKIQKFEGKNLE